MQPPFISVSIFDSYPEILQTRVEHREEPRSYHCGQLQRQLFAEVRKKIKSHHIKENFKIKIMFVVVDIGFSFYSLVIYKRNHSRIVNVGIFFSVLPIFFTLSEIYNDMITTDWIILLYFCGKLFILIWYNLGYVRNSFDLI